MIQPKTFGRTVVNIGPLFDKLPPASLESECALLGSMILDHRVIPDVTEVIKSGDDFSKPGHTAIYEALVWLNDNGRPGDLVQLTARLEDVQQLESLGGVEYLVMLAESVPSATSAVYYAGIVRDKARIRGLIDMAGRVLHTAYTTTDAVDDQMDAAEQMVFAMGETRQKDEDKPLGAILQEVYDDMERRQNDGTAMTGLSTGYHQLDLHLSGLQDGDMIIVAARASVGKTSFTMNMVEHMACDAQIPVGVFSLEMKREQLVKRILSSRARVDAQRMRNNMLVEGDWTRLQNACGEITNAPIWIDDTPGISLSQLRTRARRMKMRHGIKALVIDYLGLMAMPKADTETQSIGIISQGIKSLARELNIPAIVVCQLNRGPENREGNRPRMSDLRSSGNLEQDADVVLMVYREDYHQRGNPEYVANGKAEIIIAKQRNGPCETVELAFDGSTTRFNNLAQGSGI